MDGSDRIIGAGLESGDGGWLTKWEVGMGGMKCILVEVNDAIDRTRLGGVLFKSLGKFLLLVVVEVCLESGGVAVYYLEVLHVLLG
jgi:hypothetical protein